MHIINIFWIVCLFGMAGGTAYLVCSCAGLCFDSLKNLLIWSVLAVVFHLLPVHIAAGLELVGISDVVTLPRIVIVSSIVLMGVSGYAFRSRRLPAMSQTCSCSSSRPSIGRLPRLFHAALAAAAVSWGIFSVNQITSYPAGWDTLSYHLPVAVRWLQEQTLQMPGSRAWEYSLPENAEISMMIFLSSGIQSLATLCNWGVFLIAACAIYVIAFRMIRKILPALVTVLLFATLPLVQFQVFTGYVDLYGSSFILAGLAIFLSRLEPPPHIPSHNWYGFVIGVTGCAWGIALGTKPIFYVYAFIGALCVVPIIWAEQRHRRKFALMLVMLLFVSILLPSFFWFFRAAKTTGNPVYPLKVEMFGKTLLDGFRPEEITPLGFDLHYVRSTWEWCIYPWIEYKSRDRSYRSGVWVGAFWTALVPPGCLYGLYLLAVRKRKDYRLYGIFLLLLLCMYPLWWCVFRRMIRFGIPLFGLSCLLTTPLIDLLIRKQAKIFWSLVFCSVAITSLIHAFDPAHHLLGRIRTGVWERAGIYAYPPLIDQLPEGSVIWNVSTRPYQNFPLSGKYLRSKVIPMNWAGTQSFEEFIRQEGINYIADNQPFSDKNFERIGARKIFEGSAGSELVWRIWEIPSH